MSTVTFLGAGGGSGTTTLVALSAHLLAEQGLGVPMLLAQDPAVFNHRLGELPPIAQTAGDALVDGGRYTASQAAEAFGQGRLVLVVAHTPRGIAAQHDVLADIGARFGPGALERTLPVLCASFGRPSSPVDPQAIRVPFDARLAPGGSVSAALPGVRRRTRDALRRQWLPILGEAYAPRNPHLGQMQAPWR